IVQISIRRHEQSAAGAAGNFARNNALFVLRAAAAIRDELLDHWSSCLLKLARQHGDDDLGFCCHEFLPSIAFDIADGCCRDELEWHMLRKVRLFTPGPTPLLPAAQFAMAAADLHHRTPEFRAIYSRVLQQLKEFIGTQNDVVLLTAS